MRGTIRFKPGLTPEYKDLVNSILKYETTERLPLIKVFDHPWIRNFERKYNLSKSGAAAATSSKPKSSTSDQAAALKAQQKAAEARALAEAQEKQRQAELEAAEKER